MTKPIVVTRVAMLRSIQTEIELDWLRDRFELMWETTYPSLLANRETDLAWILLVDSSVKSLAGELLSSRKDNATWIHLGVSEEGFVPRTQEITLEEPVFPDSDDFLTFRLDSDDALMPGTVAKALQVATSAGPDALVDLPIGYRLDWSTGRMLEVTHAHSRQGPFLAIRHLSRSTMFDTGGEHTEARSERSVVTVESPAWIQVIHGGNIVNKMGTERHRSLAQRVGSKFGRRASGIKRVEPGQASEILARAGLDKKSSS